MSTVNIEIKDKKTLDLIKKTKIFVHGNQALMTKFGLFQIARMKIRTAKGIDYNGSPFKPYSPAYKLFRQSSGRSGKPNLFYSGKMLAAMICRATSKNVVITFASQQETNKANKNQRTRQFFGVSQKDRIDIEKLFKKELETLVNGA